MKKAVKAMASLALALSLTLGTTAFALDGGQNEPIEPDYTEIVEEIFPGYNPQVSPQWSSGDKDVANPGTHGFITQNAYDSFAMIILLRIHFIADNGRILLEDLFCQM